MRGIYLGLQRPTLHSPVVRLTCNQQVLSSNLRGGSTLIPSKVTWAKAIFFNIHQLRTKLPLPYYQKQNSLCDSDPSHDPGIMLFCDHTHQAQISVPLLDSRTVLHYVMPRSTSGGCDHDVFNDYFPYDFWRSVIRYSIVVNYRIAKYVLIPIVNLPGGQLLIGSTCWPASHFW